MSQNIAIVTGIPAPYRVALFDYIRKEYEDYYVTVIYQNRGNFDRSWYIDDSMISGDIFLDTFHFTINGKFDKRVIRFPRGVWKSLRKTKPDVVVIAEYNLVSLATMLWCRFQRVKYISWTDGTIEYEKTISKAQKLARRLIIGHASAYIASSTESKKNQMMYGASEEKVYLSFLTVDTQKLYHEREKYHSKKLLYVGRLVEIKGVDLLLQAFNRLKTDDVTLTVVGDGVEEDRLRNVVKQFEMDERVEFVGFQEGEELFRYFRESDIFVFPSRLETFGLAVLEAMCNSMPVICSKYVGCILDLVNEENGIVVDPYDADQFAEAIASLTADEDRVQRLGRKSYQRAKEFSIQTSGDEFVKAVVETLNPGG